MKQIQLSQGMVALVDEDDFERLSSYRWFYRGERNEALGYGMRHGGKKDRTKSVYLHREIMDAPAGSEVVFRNHNRLDCRKENLLVVTKDEARLHKQMQVDLEPGADGVHHNPETGTWSAYVLRSGHSYHVGTYRYKVQAEHFYQKAVEKDRVALQAALAEVKRLHGDPEGEIGGNCCSPRAAGMRSSARVLLT